MSNPENPNGKQCKFNVCPHQQLTVNRLLFLICCQQHVQAADAPAGLLVSGDRNMIGCERLSRSQGEVHRSATRPHLIQTHKVPFGVGQRCTMV